MVHGVGVLRVLKQRSPYNARAIEDVCQPAGDSTSPLPQLDSTRYLTYLFSSLRLYLDARTFPVCLRRLECVESLVGERRWVEKKRQVVSTVDWLGLKVTGHRAP